MVLTIDNCTTCLYCTYMQNTAYATYCICNICYSVCNILYNCMLVYYEMIFFIFFSNCLDSVDEKQSNSAGIVGTTETAETNSYLSRAVAHLEQNLSTCRNDMQSKNISVYCFTFFFVSVCYDFFFRRKRSCLQGSCTRYISIGSNCFEFTSESGKSGIG